MRKLDFLNAFKIVLNKPYRNFLRYYEENSILLWWNHKKLNSDILIMQYLFHFFCKHRKMNILMHFRHFQFLKVFFAKWSISSWFSFWPKTVYTDIQLKNIYREKLLIWWNFWNLWFSTKTPLNNKMYPKTINENLFQTCLIPMVGPQFNCKMEHMLHFTAELWANHWD